MGKIVKKVWTKPVGNGSVWDQCNALEVIPDTTSGKWRIMLTLVDNGTTKKRSFTGLSYTRGSHELKSTCTKNNTTYYIWLRAYNNFADLRGTCYKSGYVNPQTIEECDCPTPAGDDPLEGTWTATHPL